MTKLVSTCTGCCVRCITYNAVISGTHTPRSVQENDKYKILWDFPTDIKRIKGNRHSLYQQAKERVPDY